MFTFLIYDIKHANYNLLVFFKTLLCLLVFFKTYALNVKISD